MPYQTYTKERLEEAVRNSTTMVGVMRFLGVNTVGGGSWQHIRNKIRAFGISTDHFESGHKGKTPPNKKDPASFLGRLDAGSYRQKTKHLKAAMLAAGVPHQCGECSQPPTWNGSPMTLEIDHLDGDWRNNELENLRFLCPNCHSQTATFRNKVRPVSSFGRAPA